ncbi:hypothetical protein PGTUg99_002535 [Puccinia graminis f. sp. tritici]|uniref:Uncharacterized protein n=1 Tax=Puccinia graminis f. sp. tritici TaxID=56615 RepID=A0A5B0SAF3_PUCGR|nr:hypothetical protein PGTUg99_000974 [Puccinia graminis f. sp. tritici]KAA1134455.1 hypothetical protein PGTUg99_002535 [Puccinia graminis f. sp. tritici]
MIILATAAPSAVTNWDGWLDTPRTFLEETSHHPVGSDRAWTVKCTVNKAALW